MKSEYTEGKTLPQKSIFPKETLFVWTSYNIFTTEGFEFKSSLLQAQRESHQKMFYDIFMQTENTDRDWPAG